ncbi:MAG: CapA family protein [Lachnospiraceae bacterium]|nr:CapA family protein [Lachnospiraceae bacterium]
MVSEDEIVSSGDFLISDTILNALKTDTNNYDFDYIFYYMNDYIKNADYAVVNLETSIDAAKRGYDMTHKNHIVPYQLAKETALHYFLL